MSKAPYTAAEYDELPEVLTSDQVARVISASPAQVRRWAYEGVIPGRQFGTRWRFSKTVLEQLIREGTPPEQAAGASDDPEDSEDSEEPQG